MAKAGHRACLDHGMAHPNLLTVSEADLNAVVGGTFADEYSVEDDSDWFWSPSEADCIFTGIGRLDPYTGTSVAPTEESLKPLILLRINKG